MDCPLYECLALSRLHRHAYLVDDLCILRHVPAFVSEHFKIQFYGFCNVSQGFLYRLPLRVAAGQCRDLYPVTALFGYT